MGMVRGFEAAGSGLHSHVSNRDAALGVYERCRGGRLVPSKDQPWEEDDGEFACELNKTTAVEPNVICAETAYLRKKAELHGGRFDGWACAATS